MLSVYQRVRSWVSVCVLPAFLYGQLTWGMMAAERPLIPGEPIAITGQQQTTPAQPGEIQQPTPQTQQEPPATPIEGQTTIVQVPVPKENPLDIRVVDGEGASNIVGKKSSVKPSVEVRGEQNQLLEGAVVIFTAPADGASVIFSSGLRSATVMTDAAGRAQAPTMRAVNSGSFRLQVSASFRGQVVSSSISETNFDSASDAKGMPAANKGKTGGLSGTTWAIILGAGAAAAVGIGVGLGGHKGSSTTGSTTSATIGGAGTPTVGAP